MGPRAPTPAFCSALGFPTLKPPSLFSQEPVPEPLLPFPSPPGETPKFTFISTLSYPPGRPRPAAQLAPGHCGHRLQLRCCHPAPAGPRTSARYTHAHASQTTFQEGAWGGAQGADWTPRGGGAGIGALRPPSAWRKRAVSTRAHAESLLLWDRR